MKRLILLSALVCLVLSTGCLEDQPGLSKTPSGSLLRIHSIGAKALQRMTNAVRLEEARKLASSGPVLEEVLSKLAGTPYRFWKEQLPVAGGDQSALIRPLLHDLVEEEAFLELRGADGNYDFLAAVKLEDARAVVWGTNLWQMVTQWKLGTPLTIVTNQFKGWTVWTTEPRTAVMYLRAGGWVIVGAARNESKLYAAAVESLSKSGRPVESLGDSLMKAEVDWPKFGEWFPFFARWPLPAMAGSWSGEGEYVRTRIDMDYTRPLNLQLEPWKVPIQLINDPLVSFTAVRGLKSLLEHWPAMKALGWNPLPNQAVSWGQPNFNGTTFIAVPSSDPTNIVDRVAPTLDGFVETYFGSLTGKIYWDTNRTQLVWSGLPFLTPFLRPLTEGGDSYVLMGLIPFLGKTNPPPDSLIQQFKARKDLLYYDWEITEARFVHNRHYYRLADIISQHQIVPTNAPTFRWLGDLHSKLGNTITEISQESPTRLSLTRKSHVGLTGVELVLLTRWIDSPGFPLTFESPPPQKARVLPKGQQPKKPAGQGVRPSSKPSRPPK